MLGAISGQLMDISECSGGPDGNETAFARRLGAIAALPGARARCTLGFCGSADMGGECPIRTCETVKSAIPIPQTGHHFAWRMYRQWRSFREIGNSSRTA
jgi:hypothetical protein